MSDCAWWERASALVDGELDPSERPGVERHVERCRACAAALDAAGAVARNGMLDLRRLSVGERRWLRVDATRVLLLLAALALLALAIPAFVGGNGPHTHDHTQRHLAMWQIGIASGLLVASVASRFSHAMLAVAASFVVLTGIAAGYDLAAGHSGPWNEPVHLIEVVAAVLLWRLTPPHLIPGRRP
jgi:anti-sigma factor RsiW